MTSVRASTAAAWLVTEAGEVLALITKWLAYGKPLDPVALADELGDVAYSLAWVCNVFGFDLETLMEANQRKLKARFPDGYTPGAAINKNREAEKAAIIQDGHGFGHPLTCDEDGHVWKGIQGVVGSGRKCQNCGKTEAL